MQFKIESPVFNTMKYLTSKTHHLDFAFDFCDGNQITFLYLKFTQHIK